MTDWGDLRWLATIAAALIGAFVAVVWSPWRQRQGEARTRLEKVRDIQIALRAEISNYAGQLREADLQAHFSGMETAMRHDPKMTPFVPRETHDTVFRALVNDIHLLPRAVVGPIVRYYSQLIGISALAEDMRDPDFASLAPERRLQAYRHFIGMKIRAGEFARKAGTALDKGIRKIDRDSRFRESWPRSELNSREEDRNDPEPARISSGQP